MPNNEFGDFQTPARLSAKVMELASRLSHVPETILEPTCGIGSFVTASLDAFPDARVHGLELQPQHLAHLEQKFSQNQNFVLHKGDYFKFDWPQLIRNAQKPLWIVGNPPWVTNTFLGGIGSGNLPIKSPQAGLSGFDAQTGKSNFDISEAMIRDWITWCAECNGTLAVICKQSVARKILQWWWKAGGTPPEARIYLINAKQEFGAVVSACVLTCSFATRGHPTVCDLHDNVDAKKPSSSFGLADGFLVADARKYASHRHLLGKASPRWRSGIKHDARAVLELSGREGSLNRLDGSAIDIEPETVFPMLKGSDLTRPASGRALRSMIVPQRAIGESTDHLRISAPKTWQYLTTHEDAFKRRKSQIYVKGGRFSIFGVGEYSFLPWKVAIGALYKKLNFSLIGPLHGKPVLFDDTVYFLSFGTEQEARRAFQRLSSKVAMEFLTSMIFWDDMRPVKVEILNRLDLSSTALREAA